MTDMKLRLRALHGLAADIRPTPSPSGSIYMTVGNHQMIDWWKWSQNSANGDKFGVAGRAQGPQRYAAPGGGGNGLSAGSPWSPAQMKQAIDSRSIPAGGVINLAGGDYGYLGQFTGGGANGGWVTLLGPEDSSNPAKIDGNYDRFWSMRAGSSRIQFVRLHCTNTNSNTAFMNYVDNGGGVQSSDNAMKGASGADVGALGFQGDGFAGRCGPWWWVNCYAEGHGEGFGSYLAGNGFALGCVATESAYGSTVGRSNMSLSWNGSGLGSWGEAVNLVRGDNGVDYFGGAFGCLFYRAFQLHPSLGIGHNDLTDGNGGIFPTDDPNGSGRFVQQAIVTFATSGAGLTGFDAAKDGVDCAFNTAFGAGAGAEFRQNRSPFWRKGTTQPLPTRLAATANGNSGSAILWQRYAGSEGTVNLHGNIGIGSDWDGRSLQMWGSQMNGTGRGNVFSSSPRIEVGAAGSVGHIIASRGSIIENESCDGDSLQANAHLRPGSPAIGQGYIADAPFHIDFMGNPLIDRGGGRCDAGALQAA